MFSKQEIVSKRCEHYIYIERATLYLYPGISNTPSFIWTSLPYKLPKRKSY